MPAKKLPKGADLRRGQNTLATLTLGTFISWPQIFWTCICTFCLSTRCHTNGLWKPSAVDQVSWRQAERKQARDPWNLISGVWKQRLGEKNGPLVRRPINSLWIEELWTQSGQMRAVFKGDARRLLWASESGFPPALGYFYFYFFIFFWYPERLSFFLFQFIYNWHRAMYMFKVYSIMMWLTSIMEWLSQEV